MRRFQGCCDRCGEVTTHQERPHQGTSRTSTICERCGSPSNGLAERQLIEARTHRINGASVVLYSITAGRVVAGAGVRFQREHAWGYTFDFDGSTHGRLFCTEDGAREEFGRITRRTHCHECCTPSTRQELSANGTCPNCGRWYEDAEQH